MINGYTRQREVLQDGSNSKLLGNAVSHHGHYDKEKLYIQSESYLLYFVVEATPNKIP